MIKVVGTDFGTRSEVLIMVFLSLKIFDLVKKVASYFLQLDQKCVLTQDQKFYLH